MGVTDQGVLEGICLSSYQKDHILLAVQDTLSRFQPPVTEDMYLVRFIPVITPEELEKILTPPSYNKEQGETPHTLRSSAYCWCDNDARAQFEMVFK